MDQEHEGVQEVAQARVAGAAVAVAHAQAALAYRFVIFFGVRDIGMHHAHLHALDLFQRRQRGARAGARRFVVVGAHHQQRESIQLAAAGRVVDHVVGQALERRAIAASHVGQPCRLQRQRGFVENAADDFL